MKVLLAFGLLNVIHLIYSLYSNFSDDFTSSSGYGSILSMYSFYIPLLQNVSCNKYAFHPSMWNIPCFHLSEHQKYSHNITYVFY